MSLPVMIVALIAALLHASWNFLVKSTPDKALSMNAVVLGHAPFAIAALSWSPLPRWQSLPYLLAGAVLHAGYQFFLLASYRIGDLKAGAPFSTRFCSAYGDRGFSSAARVSLS